MENYAVLLLLAFCRVFGFMQMMPQLGELKLPQGTKMVIFLALTPFVVAPNMAQNYPFEPTFFLAALAIKEMLLGLFLGFLVSLPFRLPQMIGDLIDNQRGGAVNAQFNPATGDESSPLGLLMVLTIVTYFYTEGGFDKLIGILSSSFVIQPVYSFEFAFGDNIFDVMMTIINHYMGLFAILSLPVVIVMMAVDVSLGYTSKFAQSLNAFSLSQPIKAVVALTMLIAINPKIIQASLQFFDQTVERLL